MGARVLINADDYGLTRGITDTILETIDRGSVRGVSILANGEALVYACEELAKRPPIRLSLHLNLTEGRAVSNPAELPHLADKEGFFKHSVGSLWFMYLVRPREREAIKKEVVAETAAQLQKVRAAAAPVGLPVTGLDGHQHVHMLPFVFESAIAFPGITHVRITNESMYDPLRISVRALARLLLRRRALKYRERARARHIETPGLFIGLLDSGRIDMRVIRKAVDATAAHDGEIEVGIHPGSATQGELASWGKRADTQWHFSSDRARERAVAMSEELRTFVDEA